MRIDGFIYDMAAPNAIHQLLVARIWGMIARHITEKKGSRLDDHIYGEPDFVVEVLSPSTKKIDNLIKMRKYAEAGVKEYWIVDSEKRKVLAYNFEEGDWPSIYGFEDKIPVHIFPEPWELDFSEIYEYVRFMYER